MHWNIEAVDLVANAMIEVQSFGSCRFLSYQKIEQYGNKVLEILQESSDFATLNLSKAKTSAMLENFSDFFVEDEYGGLSGIILRENKTSSDLIREFRGYLPLCILLAFTDIRARQILEEAYDPDRVAACER